MAKNSYPTTMKKGQEKELLQTAVATIQPWRRNMVDDFGRMLSKLARPWPGHTNLA